MNRKMKELCRKAFSTKIRLKAKKFFDYINQRSLKYLYKIGMFDKKYEKEIKYIIHAQKVPVFPYKWIENYNRQNIDVYEDKTLNMNYVLRGGRRLYFPKGYSVNSIKKYYKSLLIEQDMRSAHRYLKDNGECIRNKIFVDVGAAEGILSLDVVEMAKKVVLFECDARWIKALEATFNPWKSKVTIVPKFVGSMDNETTITLDTYFCNIDSGAQLALKIDVEGMERDVLNGADRLMRDDSVSDLFVCTYHYRKDFDELSSIVTSYGYNVEISEGYMYIDHKFRHGLIRCSKKILD